MLASRNEGRAHVGKGCQKYLHFWLALVFSVPVLLTCASHKNLFQEWYCQHQQTTPCTVTAALWRAGLITVTCITWGGTASCPFSSMVFSAQGISAAASRSPFVSPATFFLRIFRVVDSSIISSYGRSWSITWSCLFPWWHEEMYACSKFRTFCFNQSLLVGEWGRSSSDMFQLLLQVLKSVRRSSSICACACRRLPAKASTLPAKIRVFESRWWLHLVKMAVWKSSWKLRFQVEKRCLPLIRSIVVRTSLYPSVALLVPEKPLWLQSWRRRWACPAFTNR